MTTNFESKEEALKMGIFYAGRSGYLKIKDLEKKENMDIQQIFGFIKAEVYELENSKGVKIMIGTARFRDGYDLWLISSDGPALRV